VGSETVIDGGVHVLHASLDDVQRVPMNVSGHFGTGRGRAAIHHQNLRAHAGLAWYAIMTWALRGSN
jgi:hypothetical protein